MTKFDKIQAAAATAANTSPIINKLDIASETIAEAAGHGFPLRGMYLKTAGEYIDEANALIEELSEWGATSDVVAILYGRCAALGDLLWELRDRAPGRSA